MRRGRLNLLVLGATMTCVAAAVTGCGSSESDSTTTASPPETWASGFCSSVTTWQAALTSAAGSLKSDPTKDGLQTAADDAKSATQTLASDLKDLGKPDTEAGQQAKDSLDQLSTSLQKDVDTIEETVKGVSGASEVLTAVSTVTGTLATMGTEVKTTFTDLQGLDAKGELKDAFTSSSDCDSLTSSGS